MRFVWEKQYWRTACVCLLLAGVTLGVYAPVSTYDFVQYDDPQYVFENDTVAGGVTWAGFLWAFADAHAANWHPVTWLSHMLDCQLFGMNPGAHHLVNVLFHALNSVLLFLLLRSMTGTFWRSALVAAVFAWHPLRVESVAWVAERKDVLSGFFFLLTLWAYVYYVRCRNGENVKWQVADGTGQTLSECREKRAYRKFWYVAAVAFFTLGLMSKPMLVTLPLLLLLLDFWPLQRVERSAARSSLTVLRSLVAEKLPFFVLALVACLVTVLAQRSGGALVSLQAEGLAARAGHVVAGYAAYFHKLLWPQDLVVLYLRAPVPSGEAMLLGVTLLLALSALAVAAWRRHPYLSVGWGWFVLLLLPVCGLFQAGLQSIADRYTYLPAIGLALMFGWGAAELTSLYWLGRILRPVLATFACVALLACVERSRSQLAYWQNTQTLMQHVLEVDPNNYIAHVNLGVYYARLGQDKAAKFHRARARELDPVLRAEPKGGLAGSTGPISVLALNPQ